MDTRSFLSAQEAEEAAREAVREALAGTDGPILLLLSGGSALRLLDGSGDVAASVAPRLTISVLDERHSADPGVNNFAQVAETGFFKRAVGHGAGYIDTRPLEMETLEGLAARFESDLRKWRREHPDGKTVITQGIGPDGHTAGIFPYPEDPEKFSRLFDDAERLVVGYDATGKHRHPLRVTVTLPFLHGQVDDAIVFAAGKEKSEALERVFVSDGTLAETPARIVRELGHARLFLESVPD